MKDRYTYQAFEIEDVERRENYTFVYNPYDQSVEMYNTSRKVGKQLKTRHTKNFPFEQETAYKYFKHLYNKATGMKVHPFYFLGWVHPDTIEPLVEIKKNRHMKEIKDATQTKQVLREKHKEICGSIKDYKLRKLFRKNTYIAGGAIASLIRGEKPKDYDIFFKDKETLNQTIKYYANGHNARYSNTNHDNTIVAFKTDSNEVKLMLSREYVASDEENNEYMNPIVFSNRAITLPKGFQIIMQVDDDVSILESFDYVHTMCAYYPYGNKLFVKEEALRAIQENQLIYNLQASNPVGSAKRLLRFLGRGWEVNNKEHLKLLKAVKYNTTSLHFKHEDDEYIF